ncbi:hypothetical protein AgCh_027878 [Apium graveolens]
MNRTKLPIRKRLGDVPQFSISTDAAIAESWKPPSGGTTVKPPPLMMNSGEPVVSDDVETELYTHLKLEVSKLVDEIYEKVKEKAWGVPSLKRAELEAACEDFSNVIDTSSRGTFYKGTLSTGIEIVVMSLAVESAKEWPENLEAQFRNKVGAVLRNRSFEMVEAFYTMSRLSKRMARLRRTARKSVPGGPYHVVGFQMPE